MARSFETQIELLIIIGYYNVVVKKVINLLFLACLFAYLPIY